MLPCHQKNYCRDHLLNVEGRFRNRLLKKTALPPSRFFAKNRNFAAELLTDS